MLSQSDKTIAAWKATERTLAVRVTIEGKEYTATDINSLKYDAGAYTGETFAIGSNYSNNVQIEFSHLVEGLKLGDTVEVELGVKVSNEYIYDPLGVFIISSEIKMDRNNNLTTISASDAFWKLEGVYKSKLTYPAKVLDVISEICAMAGVEPNTSELGRLPKLADLPTSIEGQSYRKTLGWIAQLYAGYATFDRSGKLTIRTVAEPSYELDPSQYEQGGLTKNEATYKISGIQCQVTTKTTTRDDQTQETTATLQVGSTSGSQIKLENNIMTQARLDDIWQKLKDINFYPFSLNWFGNPAIEAGDWLRLYDKKGNDFVVPNNGYTLEFNGGLSAVSKADQTSGSSQVVSWAGSVMQTIKELQHRNTPDGTVIFPTSVSEEPENAHFNDVWFKKNGNDTELWIFERQSDGTGKWQRNDVANGEIAAEVKRQQADLEEVRAKADSAYSNADTLYGTVMEMNTTISEIEEKSKQGVQQALEQAQKVSSDFLNYANGFNSEITLLNDAAKKNADDLNKLATDVNGIRGLYTDLNGRVTRFSAGIDGLSAQIKDTNNQLASVKLTADGANAKFANQQNEIANLKTRAGAIEQQMLAKVDSNLFESFKSSTARELKEKLTATDLNGYVKTAELERTASGLHASVTAVEGKVNGLTLGGRNYLQGTADFTWPTGIGDWNAPKKTIEQYNSDLKMLHVSNSILGGIYTKWAGAFPNGELQIGENYTFSFDAKGTGTFSAVGNESGDQAKKTSVVGTALTPSWKRYSVSGTITALNKSFVIYFEANYDVYIKCVKIEKGNKASDWSPAPEDIDNEFTTVNNTLKANKVTLDVLQNGISLNAAETSKINDKISNLGVQNLVYNSEFINNAEGWSNIGNNPAGTILFANNEWDSWKGSSGLAFRNPSKQDYLVSDSKRFKVVSGQRLSASVQLHVTDTITHGQCRAGLEIKFYANDHDSEIATSNQQTQFMYNIQNGQQKLLYCENVEVPNNANYAAIRLYTYGVGNIIFNQPMLTFSTARMPYIKDNQMIGSLQDKYASLDVKVNGIKSTVANKADASYVDQTANRLQLALTNVSVGGTNLLRGTHSYDGWRLPTGHASFEQEDKSLLTKIIHIYGDDNNANENLVWSSKPIHLVAGQQYTISAKVRYYQPNRADVKVGGRNIRVFSDYTNEHGGAGFGLTTELTGEFKRYSCTFTCDKTGDYYNWRIGDWVGSKGYPGGSIYVGEIKIEEGNRATPWSPAPEDALVAITAVKNELNTAIDLRVQKNELLSQINMQAGHTLIQSNKIYLDADTVAFSGKAFIPSAAIASLSADKINGGTINGRTVNVTNLNANNITSGTINGQNLSMNLDTGVVDFQKGRIRSTTGTLDIDIDRGTLQISNNSGEGIFASYGRLEFSSKTNWGGNLPPQYGKIYRTVDFLTGVAEGITIEGSEGVEIKTSNYNGWGTPTLSGTPNGVGLTMANNGKVIFESGGPLRLIAGDSNNITRPSISIGTNTWTDRGSDNERGQNVSIVGNGVYICPTGETMIGDGGLIVEGRLGVRGAKNSIVDTSQGKTAINAYETAEYYFGDIAKTNTGASKRVKIMIDPIFLETINTDINYHVFVSSYDNGYAWVSEMAKDYFVIESNVPNLHVSYEIKAKRKQYENVRLDKVDMNLTGGKN